MSSNQDPIGPKSTDEGAERINVASKNQASTRIVEGSLRRRSTSGAKQAEGQALGAGTRGPTRKIDINLAVCGESSSEAEMGPNDGEEGCEPSGERAERHIIEPPPPPTPHAHNLPGPPRCAIQPSSVDLL